VKSREKEAGETPVCFYLGQEGCPCAASSACCKRTALAALALVHTRHIHYSILHAFGLVPPWTCSYTLKFPALSLSLLWRTFYFQVTLFPWTGGTAWLVDLITR